MRGVVRAFHLPEGARKSISAGVMRRGVEPDHVTGPWITATSSTVSRRATGITNGGTKYPIMIVQCVGRSTAGAGGYMVIVLLLVCSVQSVMVGGPMALS